MNKWYTKSKIILEKYEYQFPDRIGANEIWFNKNLIDVKILI